MKGFAVSLLAVLVIASSAGCRDKKQEAASQWSSSPLTVQQWKKLPIDLKYEETTFERLKKGNPRLQSEEEWKEFMQSVVAPEMKKDFPEKGRAKPAKR